MTAARNSDSGAHEARGRKAMAWVADGNHADQLESFLDTVVSRRKTRRRRVTTALVLVLALTAVPVFFALRKTGSLIALDPSAKVLLPPSHRLADGSTLTPKDDASFRVEFSATQRDVTLERGELLVTVAKDPRRPFLVHAGSLQVRALGTAFSVSREANRVNVLVTEGRVAVSRPPEGKLSHASSASALQDLALLEAGNRVTVTETAASSPAVETSTLLERQAALAWAAPRLQFAGTPLSSAVPLFARHCGARLLLDPSLSSLQVSGIMRADNLDAFLRLLKIEFGIEAVREGNGVRLSRPK